MERREEMKEFRLKPKNCASEERSDEREVVSYSTVWCVAFAPTALTLTHLSMASSIVSR